MTFTLQLMLYTEHFSHILVSKWILLPINNESLNCLEIKKDSTSRNKEHFLQNPFHPPDLFWKQSATTLDNPLEFEWAISRKLI